MTQLRENCLSEKACQRLLFETAGKTAGIQSKRIEKWN